LNVNQITGIYTTQSSIGVRAKTQMSEISYQCGYPKPCLKQTSVGRSSLVQYSPQIQ